MLVSLFYRTDGLVAPGFTTGTVATSSVRFSVTGLVLLVVVWQFIRRFLATATVRLPG
jgi:hypothetical protein